METNRDERLERAVATLNELIGVIDGCGLGQSLLFLEMARLQLKLDLNGITDEEFGAFCAALENGALTPHSGERARAGHPRPRRDGDLRGMRRSWQCPQDAVSRGGRRAKQ
jgi:hypothetical protein